LEAHGQRHTSVMEQVGGNHYKNRAIQPILYIVANKLDFCEGNVIKYVTRWKDKGGVEDLKKARQYLDVLIEEEEKKRGPHGGVSDYVPL
jgi:hypothetical protein